MAEAVPHGQAHGFLFSDLRDYTRYVERHGDLAAVELLSRYRGIVREAVARFEGAEIRTEGDSFYVVFPSASSAVRCGLAILAATDLVREADRQINVGIGVHAGETIETSEGFVGSAVNIAARVCGQAGPGELLVTDTVRALTRTVVPFRFVPRGARRLKGIDEPIALYRVDPFEAAMTIGARLGTRTAGRRLPWVGAAAVMLIVIFAAFVVAGIVPAVRFSGASASSLPSGTSPAGGATGASSPTLASSPTFPTVAEADLLSRLPLNVRGADSANCSRDTGADVVAGAVAALRCTLDPATADAAVAGYAQMSDGATTSKAFDELETAYRLQKGDCSSEPAAWQLWSAGGFTGRLACYTDSSSDAWVAWTYDGSSILAKASRPDDQWGKLHAWWRETAGFMGR